jgi:hypothetical protein
VKKMYFRIYSSPKEISIMQSFLFTLLFLFNCCVLAQIPDPYKFFPSAVGNVWEYKSFTSPDIVRYEIMKDSILSDESRVIYYHLNADPLYKIGTAYDIYYDPYYLNWFYYKLDADSGETWMVQAEDSSKNRIESRMEDKYSAQLYGRIRTVEVIGFYMLNRGDTLINDSAWFWYADYLASDIGLFYVFEGEGGGPKMLLNGCIINGDTIGVITALEDEYMSLLPNDVILYQNYPNPFNPETKIVFTINKASQVKLIIYDILGREIETIVNNFKTTGTHFVKFNAKNLPSGVYICSLVTDYGRQSKKMILKK